MKDTNKRLIGFIGLPVRAMVFIAYLPITAVCMVVALFLMPDEFLGMTEVLRRVSRWVWNPVHSVEDSAIDRGTLNLRVS